MIRRISNVLVPIAPEIVLYFIISIFLLGLGTLNDWVGLLFGERQIEWRVLLNTTLAQHLNMAQAITPKLGTFAVMAFWSVVGAAVYTFVWSSANVSQQVKSEIEVSSSEFIHPKTWTARQYWVDIISQSLAQALIFFVMTMLFLSTIKVFYPFSVLLFRPLVATGRLGQVFNALLAVLLMTLVLYFAAVLVRLLLRRATW